MLESENAKLIAEVHALRSKQSNVEVLREEKRTLEMRLAKAAEREEIIAQLQAEVEAARRERGEWSVECLHCVQTVTDKKLAT